MKSSLQSIVLLGSAASVLGVPTARAPYYTAQPERAAAVQEAFDRAWNGYYTYAFPHDSLTPLTKSYDDGFAGWGASAIDALSTALIMGDRKVVNQILDFVPTIDFTKANYTGSVSLFETTIRYLGGLLSGILPPPISCLVSTLTAEQDTIC